jgi:hypothetical protein
MEAWKMKYPEPSVNLAEIRKKYHAEVAEDKGLPMLNEAVVEQQLPKEKKRKKKGKKKKK